MRNEVLDDAISIFEIANKKFIKKNKLLFENNVSERTLCGALMMELYKCIQEEFQKYSNYYVDVEYNRAKDGKVKHCIKTINGYEEKKIKINCDLIVHGRGVSNCSIENFIAIEMKKNGRRKIDKDSDRDRLRALTSLRDVYSWEGELDPVIVCGYILGIYYEVDYAKKVFHIEYYVRGSLMTSYTTKM